ncbi:hypothetical protein ACH40F_52625 [Streptomyces sp. NPDC020794]|uniref:hypothetical protein n=1 Tax=unclassified Streptomyces TaxID=2593676 RepID=UPI0036E628E9
MSSRWCAATDPLGRRWVSPAGRPSGAAVPVHQVAHRVLELLVGERVQLGQAVAQSA